MVFIKGFKNSLNIVFAFGIISLSLAQTKSYQTSAGLIVGDSQEVGFSTERLSLIDSMFMSSIQANEIPGGVALVARNGKIIYHKPFGTANAETKIPLQKDAIFRFASQTKAITATAVMMLWEKGKFRLDEPISKFIPEFKDSQILDSLHPDGTYTTRKANNPITIRHLLTHTSGLGYGVIDQDKRFTKIYEKAGIIDAFTTKDIPIGENIKKLAKLPIHHEPGEKFTYSESYDVLGYFIEILSGMPLDKFMEQNIFEPLQMNDTGFYLPTSKADKLVAIQSFEDGKWVNFPSTFYDPDYPITGAKRFFSGGAGLSGTASDYAKFLQMYLNGGDLNGKRLLSRKTVDVIMANQIGDVWGKDAKAHYGLAFMVQNQEGEDAGGQGSEGTFSWGGYFNTQYFADPEEQIIGVLLKQTQNTETDSTGWKFPILIYQALND